MGDFFENFTTSEICIIVLFCLLFYYFTERHNFCSGDQNRNIVFQSILKIMHAMGRINWRGNCIFTSQELKDYFLLI